MAGEKMSAARTALDRFLFELLDRDDEIFLYRFSDHPTLLQGWTSDRQQLTRALGRLSPNGGTAMYDGVAEAIPLAERGRHRKKAIVVISDGNDTSSRTTIGDLRQLIRESEVMVYAIGIDGDSEATARRPTQTQPLPRQPPPRLPIPLPFPGMRRPPGGGRCLRCLRCLPPSWRVQRGSSDRVNVVALRDMTDDSGGRTEIVRDTRDLDPATGRHRVGTEPAVLPRLSGHEQEGRALALHSRRHEEGRISRPRAPRLRGELSNAASPAAAAVSNWTRR